MDRLIISSPTACSVTTGANLWRSKHFTKNFCQTRKVENMFESPSLPFTFLVDGVEPLWRGFPGSLAWNASQHTRKTKLEYNLSSFQQPSLKHRYRSIEEVSTYQECNRKYIVKAITGSSSNSDASDAQNILDSTKNVLVALYRFCYPYTVMGRTLSTISISLLAVQKLSDISPLFFVGVLQALVTHFFMDLYINGVNQLYDLEIDKINKPYLPLASGQLSFTTGLIITASCLALSFWLTWITGSWPLIWSIGLVFLLWTAYSIDVPFLRWKGNPLLAAMCIVATWAFVFPITFFLHIQTFVLKRPATFPRSLYFAVAFMSFYSAGIAMFKDIPDIEGDKTHGIQSFSASFGRKRVFWLCVSLFEMAFGVAILGGVASSYLWIKIVTGLGHAVLASVLWYQAKSVDLKSKASIGSFYMLAWKMLYAAYFFLSLMR